LTGSNLAARSSPKRKSDLAPLSLQFSQSGNVIEVAVSRGEDLDIAQFEPQLLETGFNLGNRRGEAGVDKNVSLWRCDQVGRQIIRSDPVHVADDPERGKGFDPVRVSRRLRGLTKGG
jgi:hypothetical protein